MNQYTAQISWKKILNPYSKWPQLVYRFCWSLIKKKYGSSTGCTEFCRKSTFIFISYWDRLVVCQFLFPSFDCWWNGKRFSWERALKLPFLIFWVGVARGDPHGKALKLSLETILQLGISKHHWISSNSSKLWGQVGVFHVM